MSEEKAKLSFLFIVSDKNVSYYVHIVSSSIIVDLNAQLNFDLLPMSLETKGINKQTLQ